MTNQTDITAEPKITDTANSIIPDLSTVFREPQWWNRFMFLEVLLYFIPSALYAFPLPIFNIDHLFFLPWDLLAKLIFTTDENFGFDNAGDGKFGYFYLGATLIFSALAALIWVLLERKFTNHKNCNTGIRYIWRNGLRLTLAVLMIYYGALKTIPQQMPVPYPSMLSQSIGSQDGYEVLWNFMGYSPIFEIIVGLAELIGGILLFIPRFITLGGYLSLGIMIPVALMNFCYDGIPVKIISTQMCIGEIILLWPSLLAFWNYLIKDKIMQPIARPKILNVKSTGLRRTCIIIYIVFCSIVIGLNLTAAIVAYHAQKLNQAIPLNGRWIITHENYTNPQLESLQVQAWDSIDINASNDGQLRFQADYDPISANAIGQESIHFITFYHDNFIQLPTKELSKLPYDLVLDYTLKNNILNLSAINPSTHRPDLMITAQRAAPWPHHPGEFHWIPNWSQFQYDVNATHQ